MRDDWKPDWHHNFLSGLLVCWGHFPSFVAGIELESCPLAIVVEPALGCTLGCERSVVIRGSLVGIFNIRYLYGFPITLLGMALSGLKDSVLARLSVDLNGGGRRCMGAPRGGLFPFVHWVYALYFWTMKGRDHSRVELAIEQLFVSIELFLERRSYVSSLTLSGAADEVLGRYLHLQGRENCLRWQFNTVRPVECFLRNNDFGWKVFTRERNAARNSVKHMDAEGEEVFSCDLMDEALWMIVRAKNNYERLGFEETELIEEFNHWFDKNVVVV